VAVQKITIAEFLQRAPGSLVLDVRSPGEYTHAHIPGAYSLPLFNDEERAVVGTTYKKQSREKAIKAGLDFFAPKMRKMIEEVEEWMKQGMKNRERGTGNGEQGMTKKEQGMRNLQLSTFNLQPSTTNGQPPVLVHCWRGGMRSAGVAWLLDLYGFEVYTVVGGYKAYRKWVLEQFEKPAALQVLGGYTGSGKTPVLRMLEAKGEKVIDLEALAHHKGSAFGGLGEPPQPTQEMFENRLAMALAQTAAMPGPVWVEDESQRIGNKKIPDPLWHRMRRSPVFFMDIPFEKRLQYITLEYGKYEKEKLVNAVIRIQKRLGGLETKNAIHHLLDDDVAASFRILLKYYDKWYLAGLNNRENPESLVHRIPCEGVNIETNTRAVTDAAVRNRSTLQETA